jgi:hypothetical protein
VSTLFRAFFRENLNSNFSLDDYNYRSLSGDEYGMGLKWDNVRNALFFEVGGFGLAGTDHELRVTESYQLGDIAS